MTLNQVLSNLFLVLFQFRADQNEVRHLTSGNWEVTKILAYDETADDL